MLHLGDSGRGNMPNIRAAERKPLEMVARPLTFID